MCAAYFVSIALALISLIVPAFVVPVVIYIISAHSLAEGLFGFTTVSLDIRFMLDMALYLGLFAVPAVGMGPSINSVFGNETRQREMTCVAFGLHLGNYFWSAGAKLLLGPHLWTWVLESDV